VIEEIAGIFEDAFICRSFSPFSKEWIIAETEGFKI